MIEHIQSEYERLARRGDLDTWARRWGEELLGMAVQMRATLAAVDSVPDDVLHDLAVSFRARAHGIDPKSSTVEQALAAMAAEHHSDDPLVKLGELLHRVASCRDMYREDFHAVSR